MISDEELKKQLIEQMSNWDDKEALHAVEQLRGWGYFIEK